MFRKLINYLIGFFKKEEVVIIKYEWIDDLCDDYCSSDWNY